MSNRYEPSTYEAWYHTPRGTWIGDVEFAMMMKLLRPEMGGTLLDVGSGTGYFSRRFSAAGLRVTGIDPDTAMLQYVNSAPGSVTYVEGSAERLPFADQSFDYVAAVTSLCFIDSPINALDTMWRVTKRGMILGLLNSASLLYRRKHGKGAYTDARWDAIGDVQRWVHVLSPTPVQLLWRTGIFFPDGSPSARLMERLLPRGCRGAGSLRFICKSRHGRKRRSARHAENNSRTIILKRPDHLKNIINKQNATQEYGIRPGLICY